MKIKRSIQDDFQEYMHIFPATGILGPRQVGKTTLTQQIASKEDNLNLDLEKPEDRVTNLEYFLKEILPAL